jgi:hypothetical protein
LATKSATAKVVINRQIALTIDCEVSIAIDRQAVTSAELARLPSRFTSKFLVRLIANLRSRSATLFLGHFSVFDFLLAAPCCFLQKALVLLAQGHVARRLRQGGLCTQVRAAPDPRVRLGSSNADTIGYDIRRAETFNGRVGCDRDDREL